MKFLGILFMLIPFALAGQNGLSGTVQNTDPDSSNVASDSIMSLPKNLREKFEEIIKDTATAATSEEDPDLDLGLMIVNETRTRFGSEFYDNFYQDLSLEENIGSATVVVREEPFRARTTRLIIKVDGSEVVQTILRPNSGEYLEQLVSACVERVKNHIISSQEVQESLGGDDLSGSGIY